MKTLNGTEGIRTLDLCVANQVMIFPVRTELSSRVSSNEEIDEIRNRNKILASIDTKLRGMGTNLNQMAHVANGHGVIPTASELVRISESVNLIRREVSEEWRSTRLLISHQNHTGQ